MPEIARKGLFSRVFGVWIPQRGPTLGVGRGRSGYRERPGRGRTEEVFHQGYSLSRV